MLDLPRLERIRLSPRPRIQRVVGWAMLVPNYEALPGVKITLENAERLPKGPVFYAMNHTDRYNYWPFQYRLWRSHDRFTATWVKGKYYQNAFVGKFMELTNNIPTVSRGYLISRDFLNTMERPPTDEEYAALRALVESKGRDETGAPTELFRTARDMLGRPFDPDREHNAEAMDLGLDVLVFPQGTRSIRLSKGHVGLAQMALALKKPIVPVGCSGSDLVYPTGSPFGRKGRIVYRLGEPISYEEMKPFHVPEFEPFTPEAEEAHKERFQGLVDVVMERINGLVDEPYKWGSAQSSDGVQGSSRFV